MLDTAYIRDHIEEVRAGLRNRGLDPSEIFAANKARAQQIRQLEIELEQVEQQRTALLMTLPNLPHGSVPVGNLVAQQH